MQERLESSVVGRVVLSIFVLGVLAAILSWNLPESELRRRIHPKLRPVSDAVGLDQGWGVFAPDPPRQSREVEAQVAYDDGTHRIWRVPRWDPVVGSYRDYHWRKWAEHLTIENVVLYRPAAAWITREERRAGRRPVSVTLVRRDVNLSVGGASAPAKSVELYVYRVTDADGEDAPLSPP